MLLLLLMTFIHSFILSFITCLRYVYSDNENILQRKKNRSKIENFSFCFYVEMCCHFFFLPILNIFSFFRIRENVDWFFSTTTTTTRITILVQAATVLFEIIIKIIVSMNIYIFLHLEHWQQQNEKVFSGLFFLLHEFLLLDFWKKRNKEMLRSFAYIVILQLYYCCIYTNIKWIFNSSQSTIF